MQLLQKIKREYLVNKLEDLLTNEKYKEFSRELEEIYFNNSQLYLDLFNFFFQKINQNTIETNIFNKNIIFFNSFIESDFILLVDFLHYYFEINSSRQLIVDDYEKKMVECHLDLKRKTNLDFNELINNSIAYQSMLSYKYKNKILLLKNRNSFFSTQNSLDLTSSLFTRCSLFLLDKPNNIYRNIKLQHGNNKFLAQNIMFNLDNKPNQKNILNFQVDTTTKSYSIFFKSWTDANVMDSLRCLNIDKTSLFEEKVETLAEVVNHIRESGVELKLNYDCIQDFVSAKSLDFNIPKYEELSKKEEKFIQKNLQHKDISIEDDYLD